MFIKTICGRLVNIKNADFIEETAEISLKERQNPNAEFRYFYTAKVVISINNRLFTLFEALNCYNTEEASKYTKEFVDKLMKKTLLITIE